jgi:hypothetical protein
MRCCRMMPGPLGQVTPGMDWITIGLFSGAAILMAAAIWMSLRR